MTYHAHPTPAPSADAAPASAPAIRNAQGQFAGTDVVPWPHSAPVTNFASLEEVGRTIDETVFTILRDAAAHDSESEDPAPALALAPSPGSGKTTRTQAILASDSRARIGGDALFLSPTTDLSAEACRRARALATDTNSVLAAQIRGRSSQDPENPGFRMCQKWELAEKVAGAGLKVGDTLCQLREGQGPDEIVRRCPLFDSCTYQRQSLDLPEDTPVDRYGAHNFIYLPTPTARTRALRVVDEKFWPKMLSVTSASVESFTRDRRFPEPKDEPAESNIILQAAKAVIATLRS